VCGSSTSEVGIYILPIHGTAHSQSRVLYALFLTPYGANFAHLGAVPASQVQWKYETHFLRASTTKGISYFH
jgi:hypothetical protein